jgi:hypothetical protein
LEGAAERAGGLGGPAAEGRLISLSAGSRRRLERCQPNDTVNVAIRIDAEVPSLQSYRNLISEKFGVGHYHSGGVNVDYGVNLYVGVEPDTITAIGVGLDNGYIASANDGTQMSGAYEAIVPHEIPYGQPSTFWALIAQRRA